ncbi:MAG: acetyl-CoA hydrolase [Elusimicrobia bacterium GWA2_69_24]|nr:MAG: acetyl-CoA hydrolase [Elusimicrobia bacterium GWA2_69_24]
MAAIVPVEQAINSANLPRGSNIYCAGNAATPQVLFQQIIDDESIRDVDMYSVLPLGKKEILERMYGEELCSRINHRVIFNSAYSRNAVSSGRAKYQLWHLSEVARHVRRYVKPDVVFLQVSGPDPGGNYSLGTTVEALLSAIQSAKDHGGIVIAERNERMPFVLGSSIPESAIDYIVETDYDLPSSPVHPPDLAAMRIGKIITNLFIEDGCTLQFGLGEVPEAVADAIVEKGVKDLGIHTELFSDAMRKLVQKGIVNNAKGKRKGERYSVATLFLSDSPAGYDWLHYNSSVQSRASNYTNSILNIAQQPKMVSINSAIGADLHGNIWADSLQFHRIYSGVGGQSDFIRGAPYSEGGVAVIALKSVTHKNISKIVARHPEGMTTTGTAADQVILVTEQGAFIPYGLSVGEKAVGIAYLAKEEHREKLLQEIFADPSLHKPKGSFVRGYPKGFIPYERAIAGKPDGVMSERIEHFT